MTRLRNPFSFVCLTALGAAAFVASAGAQGAFVGISTSSSQGNQLISVDPATGLGTLIAPLAAPGILEGIAVSGGSFYDYDTTGNVLDRFNPATGATISSVSLGIANRLGEGGLTFGNGTGYLFTPLNAVTFDPVNELYSFNPTTGTSSLIGSTGVSLSALTFANNTLFGFGKDDGDLYSVNPATGAATLIGDTGVVAGSPIAALSAGPNGTLFASINDALYTLNPASGLATPLNDPALGIGFSSISGLAFVPSAVPEPGTVGLLAGFAAFGGAFVVRRKRRA